MNKGSMSFNKDGDSRQAKSQVQKHLKTVWDLDIV
jgi:hypothetical protein